jgi:hypothetical protein
LKYPWMTWKQLWSWKNSWPQFRWENFYPS